MIKRIKLDPTGALADHLRASETATEDRFARAAVITQAIPTGLSELGAPQKLHENHQEAKKAGFDLARCLPGAIVRVPLQHIDPNQYSPRHFYKSEEIDKIALTLPAGQDDAAHGYVEDGRVKLIDGGTRFRAAKISGTEFLDVKIEEPPKDKIELFNRARRYNDQRSQPTPVDHALSLVRLLDEGQAKNQRDLAEKIMDLSGKPMNETQVSIYVRIGRMPERVLRAMNESEATSTTAVLYAVSELFLKVPEDGLSERIDLALQLVSEIARRGLNKKQVSDLVRSHLEGPKTRQRSTAYPLNIHGHRGEIKVFEKKGLIEVSLGGLEESDHAALREEIIKTFERYLAPK